MPENFNTMLAELDDKSKNPHFTSYPYILLLTDMLMFSLEILHDYTTDSILSTYMEKHSVTLKTLLELRAPKRKYDGTMPEEEDKENKEMKEVNNSMKKLKASEAANAKAAKGTKSLTSFFGKK